MGFLQEGKEDLLAFMDSNYTKEDSNIEFIVNIVDSCQAMWMDNVLRNLNDNLQGQVVDLMTRALKFEAFQKLKKRMIMLDLTEAN
ncbi:hypothetical protein CR513_60351, partial [Mucuna pruriens]